MVFDLYTILRIATVFQFLFFVFFLISYKKGRRLSNQLLAVFLFSKALCYLDGLFLHFRPAVAEWSPHIFFIGQSFEFLLGPSLYFYVKSLAYSDFKLEKRQWVHLIPFVLHLVFMVSVFHIHGAGVKRELLADPDFVYSTNFAGSMISIYIHFIAYSIASLVVLSNYRSRLKNLYSTVNPIQLSWLRFITVGFILIWVSGLINLLLQISEYSILIPWPILICGIFLFANIIVFKGLKQPEIFSGIKETSEKQRYRKTALPQNEMDRYLKKIKQYMGNEKPYLSPSLTLNELAQRLSLPPHCISQVINRCLNQNFYIFVNSYRIEESKRMLEETTERKKTVLEILYETGFNSKSTFNHVFKKQTGMTPTQYMRLQKS